MAKQAEIRIIGEPLVVEAITRTIRQNYTVLEESDRKSFENPEHIRRYLQVAAPDAGREETGKEPVEFYYDEKSGAILDKHGGLLYESHSLKHLSIPARQRLAEIHNAQPGIDYLGAIQILVDEGLYPPPRKVVSE